MQFGKRYHQSLSYILKQNTTWTKHPEHNKCLTTKGDYNRRKRPVELWWSFPYPVFTTHIAVIRSILYAKAKVSSLISQCPTAQDQPSPKHTQCKVVRSVGNNYLWYAQQPYLNNTYCSQTTHFVGWGYRGECLHLYLSGKVYTSTCQRTYVSRQCAFHT